MQDFDLRSFLLMSGIFGGMSLVFLWAVIRSSFPKWIGGVSESLWACGLAIVAAVLLSNRTPIPESIARWIGNAALLGALLAMYFSLRRFTKKPANHGPLSFIVCVTVALLFWNTFIHDDYRIRVILAMFATCVLCGACARALVDIRDKSIPEYFTLALFAVLACMSLIRFGFAVYGIERENFLTTDNIYVKLYVVVYSVLLIALIFGFMFIVSRRLRKVLMSVSAYQDFDWSAKEESWQLARELKQAVEENELVLHYQPRVDVRTGAVIAVEALVRWQHPQRGLLGPAHFIAVAESTDAILPIGEWVVHHAAQCLRRLERIQPGIRMSINVSPKQLGQRDFVERIRQVLTASEVNARQLELELTESAVMEDAEHAVAMMYALKALGLHLSIDDFGTGYSSLSYLKRLPIDCVKVDRSFVKDLPQDHDDIAITKAIIAMGHALGLTVVAEGVETPEQLRFLQDASCDEYQGYLFSHPIPEEELMALLQESRSAGLSQAHAAASQD